MKGQANVGTAIGWGITILLSIIGSMATGSRTVDSKIDKVRDEGLQANISAVQRISTLEEAVKAIPEMRGDIKEILRILK